MGRLINKHILTALLTTALLVSCSAPRENSGIPQQRPANFPIAIYAKPNSQSSLYQLDSANSIVKIKVLRGGAMAKFGHDHIVASRNVQGYLLLGNDGSCRADFYASLNQLIVDDPVLRDEANLLTTPSEKDIAGTKTNMLNSLQAAEFPFVQLQSLNCSGAINGHSVPTNISLHGQIQEQQLTIKVAQPDIDSLELSGSFRILQSDFGIEPFSVFNGLLKVKDRLEISINLSLKK